MRQLLSQKVSVEASIKSILAVTKKAIDGEYAPKGYDKRDMDRLELALILGGARMMYAYDHEDGTASHETIRRVGKRPRFTTSVLGIDPADVLLNIQNFLFA